MSIETAYRGPGRPGDPRPQDVPLPGGPRRMPLVRDGRPLKRWRYVGIYGPDLMLCAARVSIAGLVQVFWAVWDREEGRLRERTRNLPLGARVPDGRVAVRDRGVAVDLRLVPDGDAVEVVSPHGRSYAWTRKHLAAVSGTVTLDGRVRPIEGRAIVDDSAGYHARETAWRWAAGVGATVDGLPVAWNLVDGIHDAPTCSERTVWAGGAAAEVGAVTFAADLSSVGFSEDGGLSFAAESERARDDRIGPLRSRYRQPFGTVTGSLPGGHVLAEGFGVMEDHVAFW